MTKQDFIIKIATNLVVIDSKMHGAKYDAEESADEAIKELAYTEMAQCEYHLNNMFEIADNHNLLEEVTEEAINQGATFSYLEEVAA